MVDSDLIERLKARGQSRPSLNRDADPDCAAAAVEIERLRTVIANAASTVDAILRGQHSGWDQALAKLRDDLGGDANP